MDSCWQSEVSGRMIPRRRSAKPNIHQSIPMVFVWWFSVGNFHDSFMKLGQIILWMSSATKPSNWNDEGAWDKLAEIGEQRQVTSPERQHSATSHANNDPKLHVPDLATLLPSAFPRLCTYWKPLLLGTGSLFILDSQHNAKKRLLRLLRQSPLRFYATDIYKLQLRWWGCVHSLGEYFK